MDGEACIWDFRRTTEPVSEVTFQKKGASAAATHASAPFSASFVFVPLLRSPLRRCFQLADYFFLTSPIQSIKSLRRRDSPTVPTTQSSLRWIRSPSSRHRTRHAHSHSSRSQSLTEEEVRSLGKRSGFPSCSFLLSHPSRSSRQALISSRSRFRFRLNRRRR